MRTRQETQPTTQETVGALLVVRQRDFLRFLARRLRSTSEAEDVLQSFNVKVLSRIGQVREAQCGIAWLYRVLRTTLIDHRRREGARDRGWRAYAELGAVEPAGEAGPEGAPCGCLHRVLPAMKPEYGEVVRRADLAEEPHGRIAASLGTTANAVGVRLHRARRALRRSLERVCAGCCPDGASRCACESGDGERRPTGAPAIDCKDARRRASVGAEPTAPVGLRDQRINGRRTMARHRGPETETPDGRHGRAGPIRVAAVGALVAAALLLAPGGLGVTSAVAAPVAAGFVYTVDEHGNSISVINLATGAVETVPTSISPHNVQITADGAMLLATGPVAAAGQGHGHGHGHGDERGRLLVFDAGAVAHGPVAEIEVGRHPAHVVADPQARLAFVTNADDDTVAVVDLVAKRATAEIGTGAYPHGLRVSPDGREIYVANVRDGSVSVIDVGEMAEVARIPVGATPVQVGFTPDGERVYVSLRDANAVAVIDRAERRTVATIPVGRGPIQVFATPDGQHVYVANQGTDAEPDDTVSVIDVASGDVVATVITGRGAHGVALCDDGGHAFVTNILEDSVSVIDTASLEVIATFAVGAGPNGVTHRHGG